MGATSSIPVETFSAAKDEYEKVKGSGLSDEELFNHMKKFVDDKHTEHHHEQPKEETKGEETKEAPLDEIPPSEIPPPTEGEAQPAAEVQE